MEITKNDHAMSTKSEKTREVLENMERGSDEGNEGKGLDGRSIEQ